MSAPKNRRSVNPTKRATPDAPSREYLVALLDAKKQHYSHVCTGLFLRAHVPYLKQVIDRLGITSILDYGCGKGQQYDWVMPDYGMTVEQWWGVPVTKYDPAYPKFAKEPKGRFDLVICTHTLGMIPISDHGWVLDRLYGFATKALYLAERLDRPRKLVGAPMLRPANRGWTYREWQRHVQRPTDLEVIMCTRYRDTHGGKIQLMTTWNGVVWTKPQQMTGGGLIDWPTK